ncbi:GumC family protein [Sphingomonas sp. 37zxx]|uniref:GumC family protein n=1 Tax=Sphingomonas sp. 37zxx TaxID=1550073 RepID=UPI00068DB19E|nr:AAA family ATPase [Sphingomonas sp. 37zxx]
MDMNATLARDEAGASEARLIDLRQIGATIRRRQWWILGVIAIVLIATAVAYVLTPVRYQASATVALDRRVDDLVTTENANPTLTTDSPSVDTAVQVLTSVQLASEVVDKLQLANVEGLGRSADGPSTPEADRRRAINVVRSNLLVERSGLSYAIAITFTFSDPKITAAVANGIAEQYVSRQRTGKEGVRDEQTELLRERIQKLRGEVIQAEQQVANYRGATNLIAVDQGGTSVQQQLSTLNTTLAGAQAEEAAARARLTALGGKGAGESASGLLSQLRSQEAQLSSERAGLASRYGPLHPDLTRIDRQLADIRTNIAAEQGRIRAGLQADLNVASGRVSAIRNAIGQATGSLADGNAASVQLAELERNAESTRSIYQALLDRYRQSVAGQGTDQSNAYVISRALVPGMPFFPSLPLFAMGGLAAALLASMLLVLVLEMLEQGFKSRQDIEDKLGLAMLGTVPDLRTIPGVKARTRDPMGPAAYLVENPGSIYSEAFRSIRTALRLGHADQAVRTLAISSALPNEGKTTTAICLARSAALAGQRVVLVDCDVRRRASTRSLASKAELGLIEVLKGEVPLESALLRDEASGMLVLAQSAKDTSDFDLMTSTEMQSLIQELGKRFDLVVLDTAPVLPLAEARAIAGMADGVLFVTRWRKTPVHASRVALDLLARAGADVKGVAMTLVNIRHQSRAGYGDEMMYYKQFKQYYT